MKRRKLRAYAEAIAVDLEKKPYEHWTTMDFPITYEAKFEGEEVQVEINRLELEDEYVHLSISVDSGGLDVYFPAGTSVIIRKGADTQCS